MPGWRFSGGTSRPDRIVPYGPDAVMTAALIADDMTYYGAEVRVDFDNAAGEVVCIRRRGADWANAEMLLPGRQLRVGCDGGWRIEAAPAGSAVA